MTNDTSLESSCALLLESAKKLQICKNWISSYIVKMFAKKIVQKWCIIHFWKALDHAISNMQKVLQNNLIFNQEKLKMCKFPLTGCLQKICNFFSQNLCNPFSYVIGFPKS